MADDWWFLLRTALALAAPAVLGVALIGRSPRFGSRRFWALAAAGLVAAPPILLVQYFLPRPAGVLAGAVYHAFVVAGLCEEGGKYLILRLFRLAVDRPGRPAAAWAWPAAGLAFGLGLAAFETLALAAADPGLAWLRAITAAPVHAAGGAYAGRAVAAAGAGRLPVAGWMAAAVFVHGAFDFALGAPGFPAAFPVAIALGAGVTAIDLARRSVRE